MALYEHVFIARQDLSSSQAEELITKYSDVSTFSLLLIIESFLFNSELIDCKYFL